MINGRLYPWVVASSYFISTVLFNQPLESSTLEKLVKELEPSDRINQTITLQSSSRDAGWNWRGWFRRNSSNIQQTQAINPIKLRIRADSTPIYSPEMRPNHIKTRLTSFGSVEDLDDDRNSTFFRKSLFPSQLQLESMNLREG